MDEQKEIQTLFRQQQEKYNYYLIALCVTEIGYAVHITLEQPLKYSQIPLAMAVAAWGLSVYFGLKFITYSLSILFANNALFDVIKGNHPDAGTHPERIEAASKGIVHAMDTSSESARQISIWQKRLFFSGMILFLFWHVLEMFLKISK
jgi:hypothetical protein